MSSLPQPIVNFMIVGAQKAGTTTLWSYLDDHPDTCMAWGREVHLFDLMDTPYVQRERLDQFYAGYFQHFNGEALRGESTPAYLFHPTALTEIQRYNPDMKLIVLLRDPIERALSHYAMERAQGHERWPLWLALVLEAPRLWWHRLTPGPRIRPMFYSYASRGLYRRQLRRVFALFKREQVLIVDSRELQEKHIETLQRVYRFLGLHEMTPEPAPRRRFVTRDKVQPGLISRLWLSLRLGRERRWYQRGRFDQL